MIAQPDQCRHILILRPGAIGDTLLTFPAFRLLREHFPGAEIAVVGNRPTLGLARDAGLVDGVDAFGADWVADLFGDEPTPALRARLERFDLGIVWMHAAEAADDLAGRLERAGVRATLPVVSFPPAGSRRHVADHLVDTLAPLGIQGPRPSLVLDLTQAGIAPLVVFHPGAGARRKRWPAERFAALADRFLARGYSLAITRGPADDEAVAALQTRLGPSRARVLDGLPLPDLAAMLARARLFVGNDSGVTHLAALVGAPTLAIFGPFDPAYWRPIGPAVGVVDAGQSCPHRDDPREGCRQCDLLASLDLEPVWEAASALIDRGAGSAAHVDYVPR